MQIIPHHSVFKSGSTQGESSVMKNTKALVGSSLNGGKNEEPVDAYGFSS